MKKPFKITIDDMEETAKQEVDGCCNKRIRDQWLEVKYNKTDKLFTYQWGKQTITRESAIKMLVIV